MNRREFISKTGIILTSGIITTELSANDEDFLLSFIRDKNQEKRELHLINTHTGEEFKEVFKENGLFKRKAIAEFIHFMRDYRTGEMTYIDPGLLDYLYDIKEKLDTDKPFYVLSGYRTKKTNEMLRKHYHGVAKHSLHIKGKAIDITSEHKSTKEIAKVARSLKKGGVGQYNKSHFVHVDTGRVRHWYG